MQNDGNLVIYGFTRFGKIPVWSTRTTQLTRFSPKSAYAVLRQDGNFVLYDFNCVPVWTTKSSQNGQSPHILVLKNDGNLVIYDARRIETWSSNTTKIY